MKPIHDIEQALLLFETAATKHAEATEEGNYRLANSSHDKIMAAIKCIKENQGLDKLISFLTHPSKGVAGWAALFLLLTHEKEAMRVLETIASGSGIEALSAETTLDEWKKGNLTNWLQKL